MKSFSDTLCVGAAIVGVGSTAGLWLPLPLALIVLGGAVLRVSWTMEHLRDAGVSMQPPHDDAARRLRAQGWSAFAWALAGGIALTGGAAIAWGAGAVALGMALRLADGRAVAAARLVAGATEPQRLVAEHGAPAAPVPRSRRHD